MSDIEEINKFIGYIKTQPEHELMNKPKKQML